MNRRGRRSRTRRRPPRTRHRAARGMPARPRAPTSVGACASGRKSCCTSPSFARTSIASAPCPGDGRNDSTGSHSVIRLVRPSRIETGPGEHDGVVVARVELAEPGVDVTAEVERVDVGPQPRESATRGGGCSCRCVPRAAAREGSQRATRARRAGPHARETAAIARSSGTRDGRSFALCTAKSIWRWRSAFSIASTNTPRPPIVASGTSRITSPVVVIRCTRTASAGWSARRAATTDSVCVIASALPRVPTVSVRVVMRSSARVRRRSRPVLAWSTPATSRSSTAMSSGRRVRHARPTQRHA